MAKECKLNKHCFGHKLLTVIFVVGVVVFFVWLEFIGPSEAYLWF